MCHLFGEAKCLPSLMAFMSITIFICHICVTQLQISFNQKVLEILCIGVYVHAGVRAGLHVRVQYACVVVVRLFMGVCICASVRACVRACVYM